MKVLSFDIWNTILNTRIFYRKFSISLARITGLKSEDIFERVLTAYAKIKSMRVKELIDENRIVEQSTEILLGEFENLNQEYIKKALAFVVARENLEDLILDNSKKVIAELRKRGYILVTIGNVVFWPGSYTRIILERLGYSEYFAAQIYADEVKCSKPRPCIFRKALKALREFGIEPEDVVHIGDNFREDFLGALGVGFKAVLVDRSKAYSSKGFSIVLDNRAYIIDNLEKLLTIFK